MYLQGGTCKIERGSRSDSYSCSIRFRFDSRKKGFCKRLKDHVGGNFEWEKKPECSCGKLIQAVEDKFIFVGNFVDGKGDDEHNIFYMMPVTVHIPPARRRSSRAAIQAAAMAGIGGEGRLARAAAMSEQA